MQELIAKANQVILESHYLRREGRSLRFQASALASRLGQTIVRSQRAEKDSTNLDQPFSDSENSVKSSRP